MVMAKEHLPLRLASATKLTSGPIRLVFETPDGEEHVVELTPSRESVRPEPVKRAPVVEKADVVVEPTKGE